jgi:hypothetical protein
VVPLVNRLIVVDPGNPENYNNAARAYLALGKKARANKQSALEKAYNDSASVWYSRGNKLPIEVTFSEYSPSEKQLVLAGTAPKAITLKFEALDKSGAVVATESVTTAALTPGKSAKFNVTLAAANVVGYRYTIAE